jgi:hypothetical protein
LTSSYNGGILLYMYKFKVSVSIFVVNLSKDYPLPLTCSWEQAKPVSLSSSWGVGSPLISLQRSSLMVVMGAGFPVPLKE